MSNYEYALAIIVGIILAVFDLKKILSPDAAQKKGKNKVNKMP